MEFTVQSVHVFRHFFLIFLANSESKFCWYLLIRHKGEIIQHFDRIHPNLCFNGQKWEKTYFSRSLALAPPSTPLLAYIGKIFTCHTRWRKTKREGREIASIEICLLTNAGHGLGRHIFYSRLMDQRRRNNLFFKQVKLNNFVSILPIGGSRPRHFRRSRGAHWKSEEIHTTRQLYYFC